MCMRKKKHNEKGNLKSTCKETNFRKIHLQQKASKTVYKKKLIFLNIVTDKKNARRKLHSFRKLD